MGFDWTCPYCSRGATITQESVHAGNTILQIENKEGNCCLNYWFYVCPNPKCKKFALSVSLERVEYNRFVDKWDMKGQLHFWNLLPRSKAQSLPEYIPTAIINDYNEACLIQDLSPKASATLSRRCLQGILRDFWKVKPGRLVNEIEQIKEKVDPLTWEAIEAVRKIGNIGAHMEKDIDVMVDVDPEEAKKLIELIELLIQDWYVARENRKKNLSHLVGIAEKKEVDKQKPKTAVTK